MDDPGIQVMPLSLPDHFAPRSYVRLAMIWPFDNSKEVEAAERIRTALHCLFVRYPYLAGYLVMTLGTEGADTQLNSMEIQYPNTIRSVGAPQYVVNHPSKHDFPYTYDELQAEGMPGSKLVNGLLTTAPHIPDLSKAQPVVSVTANFFQGGLILHLSFLHIIGDGTGMHLFLTEWCDLLRNGTLPDTVHRKLVADRSFLLQPKAMVDPNPFPVGYDMVKPEEGPTGINSVKKVNNTHPVSARVFSFSHDRLHGLKDALNETVGSSEKDFWISTNDCINALLWLYVTRARAQDIKEIPNTTYFTPVDVRHKRFELGLREDYPGNATMIAQVTLPTSDFWASPSHDSEDAPMTHSAPDTPMQEMLGDTIARNFTKVTVKDHKDFHMLTKLASILRKSINDVDTTYVQERLSFMANILPKAHLVRWNFRNYFGPDFFCTSWVNFGADTIWGIPGTLSKHPTSLRKPYCPDDGSSVVLPRRKEIPDKSGKNRAVKPPYEIWVQLRQDHLENLCAKDSLGGWADRAA